MTRLALRRPDDWHLHLRDGAQLAAVLPHTARRFARALVMPNLKPPMTDTAALAAYRDRILAALPAGSRFDPVMTLYLTDNTSAEELRRAAASGFVVGAKLYPAGATTHSDDGVSSVERIWGALESMAQLGLVLQVHGEVTDPAVDVFDREAVFIDRVLARVTDRLPELRIVFEHVTSRAAVDFVRGGRAGIAATITPQHLLFNRNALFEGGLRPHHYCLPVLKRERDREALVAAATGDDPRFFLGSDSAPHARGAKEAGCGCAGIYSAHAGIELYAEAFEEAGRLDRLEAFASERGADFYRLPRNEGRVVLERDAWQVPAAYDFGGAELVPLRAGASVALAAGRAMSQSSGTPRIAERFRGFLPIVVDVETGGFNAATDALLEIAAVLIEMTPMGELRPAATYRYHVQPFHGSRMDPASLAVNGIDPHHPLRPAIPEREALTQLFREVRRAVRDTDCTRAVLVGHNASFDLGFLNAAVARTDMKRNPFHPFSSFDTATLGGVAFGQTVLARAVVAAGLAWDPAGAHSAIYDAERTAELFCVTCNRFRLMYEEAVAHLPATEDGDSAEPAADDEAVRPAPG